MANKIHSGGYTAQQVTVYPLFTANKAEQTAFKRLFDRWSHPDVNENARLRCSYRTFRKTIQYDTLNGCYMVRVANMWIGIEPDGYTHS